MNHPIGVTITGADDNVDPHELLNLTLSFPFVEWGILISPRRSGTPRYPTNDWRRRFARIVGPHDPNVSAHYCGRLARELVAGTFPLFGLHPIFERVQINGFAPGNIEHIRRMERDVEFILQCGNMSRLPELVMDAVALGNTSILLDASGGRGVEAPTWARPTSTVKLGYAGGIGPENVTSVLDALGDGAPCWIDMESGVRTNDAFDIAKVRSVLEQVAAWNERRAS
jgi:hypothetical protein